MSLTKKDLSQIAKSYKDYRSPYEATKVMPKVLNCIQELQSEIARLELEVASLKAAKPEAKKSPAKKAAPKKAAPKKAPAKKAAPKKSASKKK